MADAQAAEFGSAHAGIEQQQQDGLVALWMGQAMVREALARAGVGAGTSQGSQHGAHILLAVGPASSSGLLRSTRRRMCSGARPSATAQVHNALSPVW